MPTVPLCNDYNSTTTTPTYLTYVTLPDDITYMELTNYYNSTIPTDRCHQVETPNSASHTAILVLSISISIPPSIHQPPYPKS